MFLIYYFWYIKNDNEVREDIPTSIIYENNKTIVDIFKIISENYGSHKALITNNCDKYHIIKYYNYYNNAYKFAEKLLYHIGPHPRVTILSFNRLELFYIHMGTLISSGILIGIPPTTSLNDYSHIINESCIDIIVVENAKQMKKISNIIMPTVKLILTLENDNNDVSNMLINNKQLKIISYNNFIALSICENNINTIIEISGPLPNDIATITYVKSKTNKLKGVVTTHKNIMSSIKNIIYMLQSRSNISIYSNEKVISYLPLSNIMTQMMDIYIPIATIGIVHIINNKDNHISDIIKRESPTIFFGTPKIWKQIMDNVIKVKETTSILDKIMGNKLILEKTGLNKIKYSMVSAQSTTKKTNDFFKSLGLQLHQIYTISETTGPISMSVPGCSKGAGIPMINIKIDPKTSQILVKGDSVFKGYYKDKKTNSSSRKWFKTGNYGHIDRDGTIYLSDKIKA